MYDRAGRRSKGGAEGGDGSRGSTPGKRTLTESLATPVQLKRGDAEGAVTEAAADHGLSGAIGSLPHLDRIQPSFGKHDVSGVKASVGGGATDACEAIGAEAYAAGDRVAFRSDPSLHVAAHEAAHVVQQRSGVHLKGNVGEPGDVYEQHADRVADRVVRGESAEELLDQHAGSGSPGRAVQMYIQIGAGAQLRQVATVDEAIQGVENAIGEGDPSHIAALWNAQKADIRRTLAEWIASSGELATNAREYAAINPGTVTAASTTGAAAAGAGIGFAMGGPFGAAVGAAVGATVGLVSGAVGSQYAKQSGGMPAQWRQYRNFYELGVALVHETHPQTVANKQHEAALGQYVCGSAWVNGHLNALKRKLAGQIRQRMQAAGAKATASASLGARAPIKGSYRMIGSYKDMGAVESSLAFLERDGGFENNIAVIHDMMEQLSGAGGGGLEWFLQGLGGTLPDPRVEAYQTTVLEDGADRMDFNALGNHDQAAVEHTYRLNSDVELGDGEVPNMRQIDRKNVKGRRNVGTRDVQDIDTITGMTFNTPMLAGKSMTTARLMELSALCGASAEERNALAWAIFGYWAHLYPRSTVPFHTFHEVMDIAMNYGVPYKPFHYPDPPGDAMFTQVGTRKFNEKVPD